MGLAQISSSLCPELARQKILSILHHTSDSHSFHGFSLFTQCEHGALGQERRPWIPAGSLAMAKLRRAICGENNNNLDDLKHMTGGDDKKKFKNSLNIVTASTQYQN